MRSVFVAVLALLAAGCSAEVNKGEHARGGYSVEIRATGDDQVFMITGPDGRAVAARAHAGTSALLNAGELQQALAAMPAPSAPANGGDAVSISAPGFSLHVSGDGAEPTSKDAGGEHGRGDVTMSIGGLGMHVNADDGGPGEADDRAQVRLTGLSARDVHRFITEADELSPAVQAQMLTALGLSQDQQ
jgi:hypothetical protein